LNFIFNTASAYEPWFVKEYHELKLYALIDRANRLIKNKNNKAAKPYLLYALQIEPRNIEANKMLMQISFSEEDYMQAKYYAKFLTKIDPNNAEDYYYTAVSYEHLNNPKKELLYLDKAENINPDLAKTIPFILQKSYSFLALKKVKLAQDELNKIPYDLGNPKLLLQVAELSFELKDLKRFNYTLNRINPENSKFDNKNKATYWFLDAEYQDYLGNYNKASKSFQKAIKLNPKSALFAAYGYHLTHMNEFKEAKVNFTIAYKLDPENNIYLLALANINIKLGEPKIAIRELKIAINKEPNNAALYETLGYAELSDSYANHQKASADFTKALSLYPAVNQQTKEEREAYERTKMSIQNIEKEWSVYFADSFRLNNTSFSPTNSLLPYSSYSGNGGVAVYYAPSSLKDTKIGSLEFTGGALWSNKNQNVVPVWELVQGRIGFRYQPFSEYEGYVSFERVIGIGNDVSGDWMISASYGDLIGLNWDENKDYWFYHNFYASASWFFIAQQDYLFSLYDFGEIFKTTIFGLNGGILPYLSLGGLANDQETRIDGGIGLAYLIWNRNRYYDTLSIYQKFGIEIRQKFMGNTQDTHTVRAYYQLMF